ncbi:hypothetical protein LJB78_01015 [Bacteroidales bacterium OttesenSCG-928-J16]|nr:hypothetical protein [Bacteroidales bacterium OttesenSCG-928-J16]
MKKVLLLAGCLGLLILGIATTSCNKDDEKITGCSCTERYEGYTDVYTYSLAEMEYEYGASDCSTLARNVNRDDYDGYAQVSCSKL